MTDLYPHIKSMRNLPREIPNFPFLPDELNYVGTVKIHGTNASIVRNPDNTFTFQSRNREITPERDNAGFAAAASKWPLSSLFAKINSPGTKVVLYGEWAGTGVQTGVAICKLNKFWILFDVKIDDMYQDMTSFAHVYDDRYRIFNVHQFKTYSVRPMCYQQNLWR